MKKISLISICCLTVLLLSSCSFAMKGKVTDIVSGQPVGSVTITIDLGNGKTREAKSNDQGSYRIKKDNADQQITYTADGYDSFTLISKSDKSRDVYLVPTAEETARRITQAMLDKNYETAYAYLHPFDQGFFTLDQFKEIQSDFENYLSLVKEFRVAETKDVESFRDNILQKTFTGTKAVTVVLVIENGDIKQENTWDINLMRMTDENNKEFWHWIFNRTSNS